MKELYLVARNEVPNESPVEIIRGFTSKEKAIEFFKDLTYAPECVIRDIIDGGEWICNRRLLDDNEFYGIIQTELDES